MQLITFDGLILYFLEGCWIWFSFYCLVCLIIRTFKWRGVKEEAINVQAANNLATAIVSIIDIVLWVLLWYYLNERKPDHDSLVVEEFILPNKVVMTGIILFWVTSLLFFIPKCRKNWLLSLLALIFINTDHLYSFLLYLSRDYQPSGWEIEESSWLIRIIQLFAFTLFIFLLYFILSRQKKLPYPSAWLR